MTLDQRYRVRGTWDTDEEWDLVYEILRPLTGRNDYTFSVPLKCPDGKWRRSIVLDDDAVVARLEAEAGGVVHYRVKTGGATAKEQLALAKWALKEAGTLTTSISYNVDKSIRECVWEVPSKKVAAFIKLTHGV